jgi:hypothetical protein
MLVRGFWHSPKGYMLSHFFRSSKDGHGWVALCGVPWVSDDPRRGLKKAVCKTCADKLSVMEGWNDRQPIR